MLNTAIVFLRIQGLEFNSRLWIGIRIDSNQVSVHQILEFNLLNATVVFCFFFGVG